MYRTIYSEKEDLSEVCFAATFDWLYSVDGLDFLVVRGDALLWCGEHPVCKCGAGVV